MVLKQAVASFPTRCLEKKAIASQDALLRCPIAVLNQIVKRLFDSWARQPDLSISTWSHSITLRTLGRRSAFGRWAR